MQKKNFGSTFFPIPRTRHPPKINSAWFCFVFLFCGCLLLLVLVVTPLLRVEHSCLVQRLELDDNVVHFELAVNLVVPSPDVDGVVATLLLAHN